ncbi:hypothetical protein ACP3P6_07205 [Enterobacter mori]
MKSPALRLRRTTERCSLTFSIREGDDITDPANPRAVSNWPDASPNGRPRSSTVVIVKADGGIIGS